MTAQAQMQLIPADGGIPYAVHVDRVLSAVGADDTTGELPLTRTVTEPGRGSTFHTHPAREIFYVIDGAFEFKTLHGSAGSCSEVIAFDAYDSGAGGDTR